jgi:hypothetical protein
MMPDILHLFSASSDTTVEGFSYGIIALTSSFAAEVI